MRLTGQRYEYLSRFVSFTHETHSLHSSSRHAYPSSRVPPSSNSAMSHYVYGRVQSPSMSPSLHQTLLFFCLPRCALRLLIRLPKRLLADLMPTATAWPFVPSPLEDALFSPFPSSSLPSFLVRVPCDFAPCSYSSLRHN